MQSHLINKRNELEHELKIAERGRIDPRRKQYILAKLAILERDIARIGWNSTDVEKNNFQAPGNTVRTVENTTFYVPLGDWFNQSNNS